MKKLIMNVAGIGLFLFALNSCGGGNSFIEEIEVKAIGTDGEYGESIEIVSKKAVVKGSYTTDCMVEIKVVKPEVKENYEAELRLYLLSEDGSILSKMDMDYHLREKLTRILANGSGTMKVEFDGYDKLSEEMKGFSIETSWREVKEKKTSNTNKKNKSNDEVLTTNSDVENMLDSYDAYMDSYISISKKMQKDPSNTETLSEYSEFMEKTMDLANKLEKVQGEMSTKQIQRMAKIQSRMAEAL